MITFKEDSLDDLLPTTRSVYYERVIKFLKKFRIPMRCHKTRQGGIWCDVVTLTGTDVVFKHPRTGVYVPLRHIELYYDGLAYLGSRSYRADEWSERVVPIEEIWINSKGSYRNIKGKAVDEDSFSKSIDFSA